MENIWHNKNFKAIIEIKLCKAFIIEMLKWLFLTSKMNVSHILYQYMEVYILLTTEENIVLPTHHHNLNVKVQEKYW